MISMNDAQREVLRKYWDSKLKERDEKLLSIIHQAIGQASMAWIPRPSSEVFDSDLATKISEKLLEDINEVVEHYSINI